MADIDIEEHDVLDNPAIKSIFPDLSIVKEEIIDVDFQAEYPDYYHHLQIAGEAFDENESSRPSKSSDAVQVNNADSTTDLFPDDAGSTSSRSSRVVSSSSQEYTMAVPEIQNSNRIVLGVRTPKKNRQLNYRNVYPPVYVAVEDSGPYLQTSKCFCEECSILFPTQNALDAHNMCLHSLLVSTEKEIERYSSDEENSIVCDICYSTYSSIPNLRRHQRNIHGTGSNKKFPETTVSSDENRCQICKMSFVNKDDLINHLYDEHFPTNRQNFVCSFCKQSFSQKKSFDGHLLQHLQAMIGNAEKDTEAIDQLLQAVGCFVKCAECSMGFSVYNSYIRHSTEIHHIEPKVLNNNICQKEGLICKICKCPFLSLLKYNHHIQNCHLMIKCQNCKVKFNFKNYQKHVTTCKPPAASKPLAANIPKKSYKCAICCETFSTYKATWKHKRRYHKSHPNYKDAVVRNQENKIAERNTDTFSGLLAKGTVFKCHKCPYNGLSLINLHMHHKTCNIINSKTRVCPKCELRVSKRSINLHLLQHRYSTTMRSINPTNLKIINKCNTCNIHYYRQDKFPKLHYNSRCYLKCPKYFVCKYCKLWISESALNVHRNEHEKLGLTIDDYTIIEYDRFVNEPIEASEIETVEEIVREPEPENDLLAIKFNYEGFLQTVVYRCSICEDVVPSVMKYNYHMKRHSVEGTSTNKKCHKCNLMVSIYCVTLHNLQHLIYNNIKVIENVTLMNLLNKCVTCGIHFSINAIMEHFKVKCDENPPNSVNCEDCDIKIHQPLYYRHKKQHTNGLNAEDFVIVDNYRVNNEIIEKAKEDLNRMDSSTVDDKSRYYTPRDIIYKCPHCNIHSTNFISIRNHIQSHLEDTKLSEPQTTTTCTTCHIKIIKDSLLTHEYQHYASNNLKVVTLNDLEQLGNTALSKCSKCETHYSLMNSEHGTLRCDRVDNSTVSTCKICNITICNLIAEKHTENHYKFKMTSENFVIITYDPYSSEEISDHRILIRCLYCKLHYGELRENHKTVCGKIQSVSCQTCRLNFPQDEYDDHLSIHQSFNLTASDFYLKMFHGTIKMNLPLLLNSWFECARCNTFFHNKDEFTEHKTCKPGLHCNKCDLHFGKNTFKYHEVFHFEEKLDTDSEDDKYNIFYCGNCKIYSLDVEKTHECKTIKKSMCHDCGLVFPLKSISAHTKMHLSSKKLLTVDDFTIYEISTARKINPPLPEFPKCTICDVHFDSFNALHVHKCEEVQPVTCNTCSIKLTTKAYQLHVSYHNYKRNDRDNEVKTVLDKYNMLQTIWNILFSCQFCGTVLDKYDNVIQHCQKHVRGDFLQRTIKCITCDLDFDSDCQSRHNRLHIDLKVSKSSFKILEFDYAKLTKTTWFKHIFSDLPENYIHQLIKDSLHKDIRMLKLSLLQDGPVENTIYLCSICDMIVPCNVADKHVLTCAESKFTPARQTKCTVCNLNFTQMDHFVDHKLLHNRGLNKLSFRIVKFAANSGDVSRKYVMYKCQKCSLTFSDLRLVSRHMKSSNCDKIKKVKCKLCGFLKNEMSFANHLSKHKTLTDYKKGNMQVKPFGYKDSEDLEDETKNVNVKTPKYIFYKCSTCNLCLASVKSRERHRSYNGKCTRIKKHKCHSCGLILNKRIYKIHLKKHKTHKYTKKNIQLVSFDTAGVPGDDLNDEIIIKDTMGDDDIKEDQAEPDESADDIDDDFTYRTKNIKKYTLHQCQDCNVVVHSEGEVEIHSKLPKCAKIQKVKCKLCNLILAKQQLNMHIRKHIVLPDFKTENFQIKKFSKSLWKMSWKVTREGVPELTVYRCGKCQINLVNRGNCKRHLESCTGRMGRFKKCSICKFLLTTQSYINHKTTHKHFPKITPNNIRILTFNKHSQNSYVFYQCKYCKICISRKSSLSKHIGVCKKITRKLYNCSICNLLFPHSTRNIAQHLRLHKRLPNLMRSNITIKLFSGDTKNKTIYTEQPEMTEDNEKYKLYQCNKCLLCLRTEPDLLRHTKLPNCLYQKQEYGKCKYCKYIFYKKSLVNHIKRHSIPDYRRENIKIITTDTPTNDPVDSTISHKTPSLSNSIENMDNFAKLFKCTCGLHFLNEKTLEKHYPLCGSLSQGAKCSKCGLMFSPVVLVNHSFLHHSKLFEYKFIVVEMSESNFKRTIKDEDRPVIYKCSKCDVFFTTKSSAQKHKCQRGVSQEIGQKCPFCNIMVWKSNIRSHFNDHRKHYISSIIGFKIMVADGENITSYLNDTIYRCGECDLYFISKNTARYHVANHKTCKSVETCNQCGLKFSNKTLEVHVKRHHEMFNYTKNDFTIYEYNRLQRVWKLKRNDTDGSENLDKTETLIDKTENTLNLDMTESLNDGSENAINFDESGSINDETSMILDNTDSNTNNTSINLDNTESLNDNSSIKLSGTECIDEFVPKKFELGSQGIKKVILRRRQPTSNKLYRCKECQVYFLTECTILKHVMYNHKKINCNLYQCPECKYYFRLFSLKIHHQEHHVDNSFNREDFVIYEYEPFEKKSKNFKPVVTVHKGEAITDFEIVNVQDQSSENDKSDQNIADLCTDLLGTDNFSEEKMDICSLNESSINVFVDQTEQKDLEETCTESLEVAAKIDNVGSIQHEISLLCNKSSTSATERNSVDNMTICSKNESLSVNNVSVDQTDQKDMEETYTESVEVAAISENDASIDNKFGLLCNKSSTEETEKNSNTTEKSTDSILENTVEKLITNINSIDHSGSQSAPSGNSAEKSDRKFTHPKYETESSNENINQSQLNEENAKYEIESIGIAQESMSIDVSDENAVSKNFTDDKGLEKVNQSEPIEKHTKCEIQLNNENIAQKSMSDDIFDKNTVSKNSADDNDLEKVSQTELTEKHTKCEIQPNNENIAQVNMSVDIYIQNTLHNMPVDNSELQKTNQIEQIEGETNSKIPDQLNESVSQKSMSVDPFKDNSLHKNPLDNSDQSRQNDEITNSGIPDQLNANDNNSLLRKQHDMPLFCTGDENFNNSSDLHMLTDDDCNKCVKTTDDEEKRKTFKGVHHFEEPKIISEEGNFIPENNAHSGTECNVHDTVNALPNFKVNENELLENHSAKIHTHSLKSIDTGNIISRKYDGYAGVSLLIDSKKMNDNISPEKQSLVHLQEETSKMHFEDVKNITNIPPLEKCEVTSKETKTNSLGKFDTAVTFTAVDYANAVKNTHDHNILIKDQTIKDSVESFIIVDNNLNSKLDEEKKPLQTQSALNETIQTMLKDFGQRVSKSVIVDDVHSVFLSDRTTLIGEDSNTHIEKPKNKIRENEGTDDNQSKEAQNLLDKKSVNSLDRSSETEIADLKDTENKNSLVETSVKQIEMMKGANLIRNDVDFDKCLIVNSDEVEWKPANFFLDKSVDANSLGECSKTQIKEECKGNISIVNNVDDPCKPIQINCKKSHTVDCLICGQPFDSAALCDEHLGAIGNTFKCCECSGRFPREELDDHANSH